jgi:hypothetical protein
MKTEISRSCATVAIAIETRRRIRAATLQISAKDIGWHESQYAKFGLRQLKIDAALFLFAS